MYGQAPQFGLLVEERQTGAGDDGTIALDDVEIGDAAFQILFAALDENALVNQ